LDRVQDDLVGRFGDGDGDGLLTTEAERRQVGLEPEVVAARDHLRRQPVWVHGVLSGEQNDSDEALLYPNYLVALRRRVSAGPPPGAMPRAYRRRDIDDVASRGYIRVRRHRRGPEDRAV